MYAVDVVGLEGHALEESGPSPSFVGVEVLMGMCLIRLIVMCDLRACWTCLIRICALVVHFIVQSVESLPVERERTEHLAAFGQS